MTARPRTVPVLYGVMLAIWLATGALVARASSGHLSYGAPHARGAGLKACATRIAGATGDVGELGVGRWEFARAPQVQPHDEREQKPAKPTAGPPTGGGHDSHPADDAGGEQEGGRGTDRGPAIPPITDADRAAAFPDVRGHAVHDQAINYFVLLDQFELGTGEGSRARWENAGWIGGDIDRVWFRTRGATADARLAEAEIHVLYGRAIARWWDVVGGLRQDFRPGPARSWLAVGLQGLAPYRFDVEATAYVGEGGRTLLRLETDYQILLTNRLVVQPGVGADIAGKADEERGIGRGVSTMDAGVRVRYEIRREVAPYVGLAWSRRFFGTAKLADTTGERSEGVRVAVGLRLWF